MTNIVKTSRAKEMRIPRENRVYFHELSKRYLVQYDKLSCHLFECFNKNLTSFLKAYILNIMHWIVVDDDVFGSEIDYIWSFVKN